MSHIQTQGWYTTKKYLHCSCNYPHINSPATALYFLRELWGHENKYTWSNKDLENRNPEKGQKSKDYLVDRKV